MKKGRILLPDILFTGLLAILLVTSFVSYQRISSQAEAGNLLTNSYQVKIKLNQLLTNLLNAETGQRGFILTKKTTFLQPYYGAFDKVKKNLQDAKQLIGKDDVQQKNLAILSTLLTKRFSVLDSALNHSIRNPQAKDSLFEFLEIGKNAMDEIRSQVAAMIEIENHVLEKRTLQKDRLAFITPLYSLLLSVIAIAIVTIAYFRLRNEIHLRVKAEANEATAQEMQKAAKSFADELEVKVAQRTEELKRLNEELKMRNDIYAYAEENALIGSYSWNIQTGELKYSDNLFRLLGYEPGEFVPTFDTFTSMVHPEDKRQVLADGKETKDTQALVEHVYRVVTKQNTIIYCRSSGTFIESNNDKVLVGTVQDISKDILLRETLAAKNLELERNNEELESFTYIASHDLQEPLRKIQSFSKLILTRQNELLTPVNSDYFTRIMSAAARMQHLIQALLSYSNANNSEIKFTTLPLTEIVEEVKNNLAELLEEKTVTLQTGALPTLPVIQIQAVQLFSNIIHNAIKYSKTDVPPVIRITSVLLNEEELKQEVPGAKGKYWKICIADNGIGFDQQYEHKIFELFQRLHGRSAYEGTGIGLAICKKIMHNHHGFITASGQTGIGAVFNLYLPYQN